LDPSKEVGDSVVNSHNPDEHLVEESHRASPAAGSEGAPGEALAPAAVARSIAERMGPRKASLSFLPTAVLGLFGGAYIAFGAELATLVMQDASAFVGVGIARLFAGVAFSLGLLLVIVAGAELFTGNNLLLISVLDRRISVRGLFRNWSIVYAANFAGSLLVAGLVYATALWKTSDGALGAVSVQIANSKVDLSFIEAFTRGILCNWLVCLAVWIATAARSIPGKAVAVLFPVAAFVACGFEHSIANMYFIPMGLMLRGATVTQSSVHLTWGGLFLRNLLPVTIGNVLGGGLFVGSLYWIAYMRRRSSS